MCELCSFWGKRCSEGVWGQFHAQVESPGGQLGIVALTPGMADRCVQVPTKKKKKNYRFPGGGGGECQHSGVSWL